MLILPQRDGLPPRRNEVLITPYRSLVVTVAPSTEPITVSDTKQAIKVDISDDDTLIGAYITAAREYVEGVLDCSLITQTLQAKYDCFPYDHFVLPRSPMQSGTVTIAYVDANGGTNTITSSANDFRIDSSSIPGRVFPNYASSWPPARGDESSVTLTWTAGYGSASDVPTSIKQAMYLLVAHWYEMRQPVVAGYSQVLPVPKTVDTLLSINNHGVIR